MNSSSFVPVDSVIALATSVIENSDSMDRAFFKDWVYLGLKEIGPSTHWYGEATLYPVDGLLEKPKDMHSAIDLALYDASGKELKYTYRGLGTRIHESDREILNTGIYAPVLGAPIDLSEDVYYFHLGSSQGAQQVAYANLKYWKFPVDENGDLLVPDEDQMALVQFLRYMWYMRKDDKQGISMSHPVWIRARNEARGAHKIPTQLQGTQIARSFSSMIQKMRFKQF